MDIKNGFLEHISSLGTLILNAPMSDFTTFACGGAADLLIIPRNVQVLPELFKAISDSGLPLTVIGGGSNLLVGDRGIRGAVIAVREHAGSTGVIEVTDGLVYADAVVKKSRFIDFCLKNGLGGIVFMAGIPGCIGGGVAMNAGANDGNFSGILKRIACVDKKGGIFTVNAEVSMSAYREFSAGEGVFIAGAFFELSAEDSDETAKSVQHALAQRALKHPLEYPS
ncbi:MAG: FAD-binding protein, partial [Leptospirales bacterium]|nr:FAD-binding protein [Leptospirales bacterium]